MGVAADAGVTRSLRFSSLRISSGAGIVRAHCMAVCPCLPGKSPQHDRGASDKVLRTFGHSAVSQWEEIGFELAALAL